MRVPARRSRKIQRRLRTVRLMTVSTPARASQSQKAGPIGPTDPAKSPSTRIVATMPTSRIAAADAVITTHAIARGDLAPAVDSEYATAEAGDVALSDHTAP